jgi:PPOX class probable F420-dependent enzyme
MELPPDLVGLLQARSTCYVATTMPDGSPQLTLTWADTDGTHLVINTVDGHQKVRNVRRDPRVAVTIADPAEPSRYFGIRGRVIEITDDGAAAHIDVLAERYTGRPYQWYGGRDQRRLILRIEADRIHRMG